MHRQLIVYTQLHNTHGHGRHQEFSRGGGKSLERPQKICKGVPIIFFRQALRFAIICILVGEWVILMPGEYFQGTPKSIKGSFHLKSPKKSANLNGSDPDFDESAYIWSL